MLNKFAFILETTQKGKKVTQASNFKQKLKEINHIC